MKNAHYNFLVITSILLGLSFSLLQGCQNSTTNKDKNQSASAGKEQGSKSDTTSKLYPKPRNQNTRGASNVRSTDTSKITIGYVEWTEGIAMTHIVEEIIEQHMNLQVDTRKGYVGQILDSLAIGAHDVFLDHWLAADSSLNEMNDFTDLAVNYRDACMGLVVPEYMEVTSILDLADYDKTGKKIIGIDQGSDVMQKTKTALKAYNLDYELVIGSGPAMVRQLQQKIQNKEPIIVTGWRPHWKFGRFDLKFLDDPNKVYGDQKNIHTLVRKNLRSDHPRVVEFLKNFRMNTQQLADLMEVFAQSNDWEKAADQWCKNHEPLIQEWMPEPES